MTIESLVGRTLWGSRGFALPRRAYPEICVKVITKPLIEGAGARYDDSQRVDR